MENRKIRDESGLPNLTPPFEVLAIMGMVGCLLLVGWVNYGRSATRSRVSQVRSDMALMRRGIQAYYADQLKYPLHTWPCEPYEDEIDGTIAVETFTYGMTTPVAYLQSLPVDPFLDGPGLPLAERLYRYGSSEYFRRLLDEGTFCTDEFDVVWAPSSQFEMDNFDYYFGRYFLLSAGPDRALDPGEHTGDGVFGSAFQTYDATNGAVSWGNIVASELILEPRYVPVNAFLHRSGGR